LSISVDINVKQHMYSITAVVAMPCGVEVNHDITTGCGNCQTQVVAVNIHK